MKLIILYGPPASGKYTIASALADKTGYKLFHNHLTIDLLKSVFTYGTSEFFKLNQMMRLEVFEEAAKQNIPGIIFTYVYEKEKDDHFIRAIIERLKPYNAEVTFIQIYCEEKVLLERVIEESRNKFMKIKSQEGLLKNLREEDIISSIPFVDSQKIDNTHLSIEKTVEKVLESIK